MIAITAKVKIDWDDPTKTVVVIRRVQADAEGRFVAKHGLTATGEWVKVGEGMPYPESCYLPVAVYDNFTEEGRLEILASREWEGAHSNDSRE